MADNNAADATEDRGNKSILIMESESLLSWLAEGTRLKESLKNEKWGKELTKTKKQVHTKDSKSKRRYRSTSLSLSTEKSFPSPKKHNSRGKRKHCKRSSPLSSSSPSSSSAESLGTKV